MQKTQKLGKEEQQFREFKKVLLETKRRYMKKYGKNGAIKWKDS